MLYCDIRALVIDDKPFSRATTVRLLRAMGLRKIEEAVDGASGLKAYATHWPHVVVCAPEMSPVDGIVFLQALMAERRQLARVAPVIFLSDSAREDLVSLARKLGASGFLLKPISLTALRRQIDFAIAQGGDLYGEALGPLPGAAAPQAAPCHA